MANEVVNPTTGQVIKKLQPQVKGHVTISPTNYAAILSGLEGVITKGTGAQAFQGFPASWNLAGKTGTATNQHGLEPNSWFVAFGPNPNPTYLVLAVIDQGGYGAGGGAARAQHLQLHRGQPHEPAGDDADAGRTTKPDGTPRQRAARDADATTTTTARPARRAARGTTAPPARARPPRNRALERPVGLVVVETLWPQIERLLPMVSKPARYAGGEQGSVYEHGPGVVAWLLVYPDIYDIGLPNQGLQILYEILNERPDALAERCLRALGRHRGRAARARLPLFSLESAPAGCATSTCWRSTCRPSSSTPTCSTARSRRRPRARRASAATTDPLRHRRRPLHLTPSRSPTSSTPSCSATARRRRRDRACWPPAAGVTARRDRPHAAGPGAGARRVRPVALRRAPTTDTGSSGSRARYPDVPAVVEQAPVADLDDYPFPDAPARAAGRGHPRPPERRGVRGCTEGCRFCQAGMIYRPVRERPADQVADGAPTARAAPATTR